MIFLKALTVFLFSLPALAQPDSHMRFRYVPNEGMPSVECTHKRIRDLPDWDVRCGEKKFAAHVIIREFQTTEEPRTSLELLYWVTERNAPSPIFSSHTSWIRLKKGTNIDSLVLSQSVENDYASLTLEWTRP